MRALNGDDMRRLAELLTILADRLDKQELRHSSGTAAVSCDAPLDTLEADEATGQLYRTYGPRYIELRADLVFVETGEVAA
jgi:hypothetical protein